MILYYTIEILYTLLFFTFGSFNSIVVIDSTGTGICRETSTATSISLYSGQGFSTYLEKIHNQIYLQRERHLELTVGLEFA